MNGLFSATIALEINLKVNEQEEFDRNRFWEFSAICVHWLNFSFDTTKSNGLRNSSFCHSFVELIVEHARCIVAKLKIKMQNVSNLATKAMTPKTRQNKRFLFCLSPLLISISFPASFPIQNVQIGTCRKYLRWIPYLIHWLVVKKIRRDIKRIRTIKWRCIEVWCLWDFIANDLNSKVEAI